MLSEAGLAGGTVERLEEDDPERPMRVRLRGESEVVVRRKVPVEAGVTRAVEVGARARRELEGEI